MNTFGRGSVEKRGANSYRLGALVECGGEKKRLYKTVRASGKRNAQHQLQEWVHELSSLPEREPCGTSSATVAEWFRNEYVDACRAKDLRPKTIEGYMQAVESRVIPAIGDVPIDEITSADLTKLIEQAKLHGSADGGSLSARTVKKLVYILNVGFRLAVSKGVISSNPMDKAETFIGKRRGAAAADEEVAFSAEELRKLFEYVEYHDNRGLATAAWISGHTAGRRAETLGLRWCDFDFDRGTISIEHDLYEASKKFSEDGKSLSLGPTKTPSSFRCIPMTPSLKEFLLREKKIQQTKWRLSGREWTEEAPVCQNKSGGFMRPSSLSTDFKEMIRDIDGIPDEASFKSMRSGVASLLADENVPLTDVAALLGHANLSTTLKFYIKQVGDRDPAMRRVGSVLEQALTA